MLPRFSSFESTPIVFKLFLARGRPPFTREVVVLLVTLYLNDGPNLEMRKSLIIFVVILVSLPVAMSGQLPPQRELLWSYRIGEESIVSMSSDGKYIAAMDSTTLYLFSRTSNTPLWSYDLGQSAWATISGDGNYIAAITRAPKNSLLLFHRDSNNPLWSYSSNGGVERCSISSDGSYSGFRRFGTVSLF